VWSALGIEVVQDESLPGTRVARGADRFVLTEIEAELSSSGPARKLPLVLATSSLSNPLPELPATTFLGYVGFESYGHSGKMQLRLDALISEVGGAAQLQAKLHQVSNSWISNL